MSGRTKGPRTWPADAHKLIDESIADAGYWKAECRKAQDEARHNSEGWNTALDVAGKYLKQRETLRASLAEAVGLLRDVADRINPADDYGRDVIERSHTFLARIDAKDSKAALHLETGCPECGCYVKHAARCSLGKDGAR